MAEPPASSLFAELKRRKVVKAGAAYVVIAWLAVQGASIGFPAFGAPDWALRIFILVLLLGFPIVLVLTWVLDLGPDGVRVEAPAAGSKRLFAVAAGLAVLALAWYYFGQPTLRPGQKIVAATTAASAAAAPPASAPDAKSIAVLPFADLSPGHDQDYFSDGMAEEILNALAQVKDLKVAGRTSSFYYKGRSQDLRAIGKALDVAHVLEGSVRTQGQRVRITAQLIRSSDGFHLWSRNYDGELSDVFKLQDQIARAIVDELQPMLEGGQKSQLVAQATTSPEAYALYLQASAVFNRRDYVAMAQAVGWLEQALALDPKFARAESLLALIHALGQPRRPDDASKAEQHARAAMALDPTLAQPLYVLGAVHRDAREYVAARDWLERAVALQPGDASANLYLAQWLIITGYTKQGIAYLDRALAIDPMLPNALNWRAYQYVFAGDVDAAQSMFERAHGLGLSLSRAGLGEVAIARGDFPAARRWLLPQPVAMYFGCLSDPAASATTLLAGTIAGDAAARARSEAIISACMAADPGNRSAWIPISMMRLGQHARALEWIARERSSDDAGVFFRVWSHYGREMRQLPGFQAAADRIGFIDAWEKFGAPDLCRRMAPRQYACQ